MSGKTQALYDAIQDLFNKTPKEPRNKDTEIYVKYTKLELSNVLCQFFPYEHDEMYFRVYKLGTFTGQVQH